MNAVIYARFSSHNQREQSIEGQLRDCHEYARRYNISVVGEYIDRAISGMTDERPDFQRMITDAAKKQFDRIIVWKLDRFARNRYDSALYKHRLKQYGVRVISAMENVGEGDESILLEALLEASAEYYSLDLKKKIKRGQRENIAKGRFCGGPVPYGWKAVDGKLVLDEKTAPHKRYFLEQYADGVPVEEILDELYSRGVRSRSGGKPSYSTFVRSLSDPICVGRYMYNGEPTDDIAERMIPDETFERIKDRLAANRRAPATRKASVEYLLHGKAYCGCCGAHLIGECGRGRGGKYYYYTCANRKKSHTCDKALEKKEFLEWFVVEQTLKYVLNPVQIRFISKRVAAEFEKEFSDNTRIDEYEKAVRRCESELNKLVDALIEAPPVAHSRIYAKMQTLEEQKASLEVDLARLRIASETRLTESDVAAWLRQFCSGDVRDPEYRQTIIETFVNAVIVHPDRIVIFYNIHPSTPPSPPNTPTPPGSDLESNAPPFEIISEPKFIYMDGKFGYIFPRSGIE